MKRTLMSSSEEFWFNQGYNKGKIEGYQEGYKSLIKYLPKK